MAANELILWRQGKEEHQRGSGGPKFNRESCVLMAAQMNWRGLGIT